MISEILRLKGCPFNVSTFEILNDLDSTQTDDFKLGTVSREKTAVLLDFVQITPPSPPPNMDKLYTFFPRRNSRFESQFRTKDNAYYLPTYKKTV